MQTWKMHVNSKTKAKRARDKGQYNRSTSHQEEIQQILSSGHHDTFEV